MLILGNRKSILGGSSATWQYGPSGELTDVRNASFTGATISRYAYTYDAALRRTAVAKSGRAFATEDDISYGYNHRSELTNATAQADSAYRYAYDFDDIGNRKTSAERTAPSVSYTANSLNQYTAIDDFVPTYDADGNQTLVKTKTGIWHVTYNGENRPVRWECGTNVITMTYDRMGRRVSKNDQTFIYDGYLQIADNRGSSYIWDPTEPVATRPLVRNNSEFYFHDGNKNVSDILSATGSVVSHYDYAPFGDCTTIGSNPWRFSSEYSDDDLGLIYYNYRHYDACMGRWLGRDPYKEDEDTFFVNNDPIELLDWLGLVWERSTCVSIRHSKNFDFRNKPLGKLGAFKFDGTLMLGYSLKGEACIKCCEKGDNAGLNKWSGSGEVVLSGEWAITAKFGVDFKTDLFWNLYRLYLFGGFQASVSLSGSGTGSFEFDGCEKTGMLNASISDSLEFAVRLGVDGYLKRRGRRIKGRWHYDNIAGVAALVKGTVSTSLQTKLSCNTEKCILTSSFGGFEANIGLEFTYWRKQLTFDLWRFQREGYVFPEMEFESPLKRFTE